MIVRLQNSEIYNCLAITSQIQILHLKRKSKETYDAQNDFFEGLNIANFGFIGELAVAKAYNKFWFGNVGVIGEPDVDILEVRTVKKSNPHMYIYKKDRDMDKFVLVSVENFPDVKICGWEFAGNLKKDKYWNPNLRYPTWHIPNDALRPADELLDPEVYNSKFAL